MVENPDDYRKVSSVIEGIRTKRPSYEKGKSKCDLIQTMEDGDKSDFEMKQALRNQYLALQGEILNKSDLFDLTNPAANTTEYSRKIDLCAELLVKDLFEGCTQCYPPAALTLADGEKRSVVFPTEAGAGHLENT